MKIVERLAARWDTTCARCRAIRRCLGQTLLLIWAAASIYGVVVVGYWAIWQRNLLIVHGGAVVTPAVAPGGELRIVWDLSKLADSQQCDGTLHRYLTATTQQRRIVDFGDFHVDSYAHMVGEHLPIPITMPLPADIEPGLWFYQTRLVYRCDPLDQFRPEVVQFPSIPFRVTPP